METRYFYRTETDARGVERRFTVAYRYDADSGTLDYGASVFRQDRPTESYHRKAHRETADARLRIRPVRLNVETGLTYQEVEDVTRWAIACCGVKGPRVVGSDAARILDNLPDGLLDQRIREAAAALRPVK